MQGHYYEKFKVPKPWHDTLPQVAIVTSHSCLFQNQLTCSSLQTIHTISLQLNIFTLTVSFCSPCHCLWNDTSKLVLGILHLWAPVEVFTHLHYIVSAPILFSQLLFGSDHLTHCSELLHSRYSHLGMPPLNFQSWRSSCSHLLVIRRYSAITMVAIKLKPWVSHVFMNWITFWCY